MITEIEKTCTGTLQEALDEYDKLAVMQTFGALGHYYKKDKEAVVIRRKTSLGLLVTSMNVVADLMYYAMLKNQFIVQVEVPSIDPGSKKAEKRYEPNQAYADFLREPTPLVADLATKLVATNIRRYCPKAIKSRGAIRYIMKNIEDLGIVEKESRTFGDRQTCRYTNINMFKLVFLFRDLESIYWEYREERERDGKTIVELPFHMFRFAKEVFEWTTGMAFTSRSSVDYDDTNKPPEEKKIAFIGNRKDALSRVATTLREAKEDIQNKVMLALTELDIVQIQGQIKQAIKHQKWLKRQIPIDMQNFCLCSALDIG